MWKESTWMEFRFDQNSDSVLERNVIKIFCVYFREYIVLNCFKSSNYQADDLF